MTARRAVPLALATTLALSAGPALAVPETAESTAPAPAPAPAPKLSFFDPEDGMLDLSDFLLQHKGALPVPAIITEPAIGYGL
ncbi:UNVERIFIED_CONTAM: hypothetical protein OHV15_18720, partial [Microbacterium sp. SLM126]